MRRLAQLVCTRHGMFLPQGITSRRFLMLAQHTPLLMAESKEGPKERLERLRLRRERKLRRARLRERAERREKAAQKALMQETREQREQDEIEVRRLVGDTTSPSLDELASHVNRSASSGGPPSRTVPMEAVLQAVRKLEGAEDAPVVPTERAEAQGALPSGTIPEVTAEEETPDADTSAGPVARELRLRCPEIASQYDPKNEQPLEEVMYDSAKLAKWRCGICAHKWTASVIVRCIYDTPCPKCTETEDPPLAKVAPGIVREWDRTRNDPFVDPAAVSGKSVMRAHWTCGACKSHFEARVRDRVAGKAKCATCALLGFRADPDREEQLRLEWHPNRNGDLQREHLKVSDHKKVWWLCQTCGREWEAMLSTRLRRVDNSAARGSDCPYCVQAKKASAGNSSAAEVPK